MPEPVARRWWEAFSRYVLLVIQQPFVCVCRSRARQKCRFSKGGRGVTFSLLIMFPACLARKTCDGRAASGTRLMAWSKHAGAVQALVPFT